MPRKNTLKTWKDNGLWPEYRKRLKTAVKNQLSDKDIASCLSISQATYIDLKKKEPEILEAIEEAKREDMEELLSAMRSLALGTAKTVTEKKAIKTKTGGVSEEKVIGKTETTLAPNKDAIEYLLATGHDERYSVPYRKLKMLEENANKELEEINNARFIGQDSEEEGN